MPQRPDGLGFGGAVGTVDTLILCAPSLFEALRLRVCWHRAQLACVRRRQRRPFALNVRRGSIQS